MPWPLDEIANRITHNLHSCGAAHLLTLYPLKVVFPTGIDRRDDLGTPDRFDIYYRMADNRTGVVRLDLPDHLPAGADADSPAAKV